MSVAATSGGGDNDTPLFSKQNSRLWNNRKAFEKNQIQNTMSEQGEIRTAWVKKKLPERKQEFEFVVSFSLKKV